MTDVVSTPVAESTEQAVADKLFDAGAEAKQETKPAEKPDAANEQTKKVDSSEAAKLELKLEGLADDETKALLSFAEKNKLNQETLTEMAKEFLTRQSARDSAANEAHEKQIAEWRKKAEADPHMGGADFQKNVDLAKFAVKKFGSEELIKILDGSGYGNHPEIIRLFSKIGQEMKQDQMVRGQPTSTSQKSLESVFYGGTKK